MKNCFTISQQDTDEGFLLTVIIVFPIHEQIMCREKYT